MLKYAKEKLDDVNEVKFVYTDIHGNLKVVLNLSPVHHKSVFDFQTKSDIGILLFQLSGGDEENKNLYDNTFTLLQDLFQKVRACVQFFRKRSKKGQKIFKKGKKGQNIENLGKNVQNLKTF